ncbi:TetR/AcrR family transcriptional regulator [Herminiimonas fonticola]|uniref:TetR family transcriptional regulator n=1 Tax=Herminiimonas fonticola TaxID=303380 RepID=A0A4R6G717_9BURK|nr:TetR/AcrR family transcriptional regulator [Herminiimonas fonticola]RBA24307.1 Bacterial regulatory protein, tetR family [Herminiimonas fonticola]TDN90307.1 TetR family transcriptional regulator [Herminiimonas fonticola]
MSTNQSSSSSDKILAAATRIAQAHGYRGLNLRTLAEQVGIKAASLYHHFPSKADLAAAVARRYADDSAATLEAIAMNAGTPEVCLNRYPETFRRSLENGNRICLCSFMTAEYDDLPLEVQVQVQAFAEVNVAWLGNVLQRTGMKRKPAELRARAIFAAISGAQLMARGRQDIKLFDSLIESYRAAGLLSFDNA